MSYANKKLQEEAEAGLPDNEFLTELQLDYLAEMQSQEYKELVPSVVTVVDTSSDDGIPF